MPSSFLLTPSTLLAKIIVPLTVCISPRDRRFPLPRVRAVRQSHARLEDLYRDVQGGDPRAWSHLYDAATSDLTAWLKSHTSPDCPPWEIRDTAHDAFVQVALHFDRISSWAQAWAYARKTAQRALRRTTTDRVRLRSLRLSVPDPKSSDPVSEYDAFECLMAALERLSLEELLMLRSHLRGAPSLPCLASQLGTTTHTLTRHYRRLYRHLCRRLADHGLDS